MSGPASSSSAKSTSCSMSNDPYYRVSASKVIEISVVLYFCPQPALDVRVTHSDLLEQDCSWFIIERVVLVDQLVAAPLEAQPAALELCPTLGTLPFVLLDDVSAGAYIAVAVLGKTDIPCMAALRSTSWPYRYSTPAPTPSHLPPMVSPSDFLPHPNITLYASQTL